MGPRLGPCCPPFPGKGMHGGRAQGQPLPMGSASLGPPSPPVPTLNPCDPASVTLAQGLSA